MCIYEYNLPSRIGQSVIVLPLCFFLSEYDSLRRIIIRRNNNILIWLLVVGVIYVIYSIIISPHLRENYMHLVYPIRHIIGRYLLPFVALVCIQRTKHITIIFNISFYAIIIMTLFGIVNLFFHHSHYVDWLYEGRVVVDYLEEAGAKFEEAKRFRVQATFHNPFDYGYTCIVGMLLFWFGYLKKYVSKEKFIIITVCALFGVLSCNCRTVFFSFILALMCFSFICYDFSSYLTHIFGAVIVGALAIIFVPYLNEKFMLMLTMFDRTATISGSSIDMRIGQLVVVLNSINNRELFGCGVGFFAIDLGWHQGKYNLKGTDFFGLEGSYLQTLLETGVIGTIFYFSIIGIVLYWAWMKRRTYRLEASFLFSLFFLFFVFGAMTGELRTAYLTFLLSGIPFKFILSQETHNKSTQAILKQSRISRIIQIGWRIKNRQRFNS